MVVYPRKEVQPGTRCSPDSETTQHTFDACAYDPPLSDDHDPLWAKKTDEYTEYDIHYTNTECSLVNNSGVEDCDNPTEEDMWKYVIDAIKVVVDKKIVSSI